MGLARLRQALPSALPILLGVLLLLLPVVTGQPGTETTDPSPEEQLQSKLAPYAPYIGGIIAAMGGILALAGKSILRVYLAIVGFLFGAFASYVILERISVDQSLGPNKDIIQLVVGIVAGIIGVGLGLCAAKLAVLAVGALFGLALTMGLLSIPEVSEAIRSHLPSWGLALIVIAVSIAVIFLLEDYVYIAVTALIGALAAAMGADLIMKTGFNQEAMRCLTSPHPPADFQGTDEMRPILYVFLGVLIAGSLFQLSIVRGRRRKASRERDRQEFDVERGYGRHSSGGATARVWE